MDAWNRLLLGAIAMGFLTAGAFFLRFWKEGRDRFFLLFGLALLVEGANRFALGLAPRPGEGAAAIYLVRLLSFLLILAAIIDKNRSARRSQRGGEPRGRSSSSVE